MFQKPSLNKDYNQKLVDELLELLKSRKDVKAFDLGNGQVIICTLAPNFKTMPEGLSWKQSGFFDFINHVYYFCQSDPGGADNWTQYLCKILCDLLTKVYPDFVETFEYFFPENKRYLTYKLFDQTVSCSEIVFALKEIIAFYNLLKAVIDGKMSNEELTEILSSFTTKNGDDTIFPYSGTLEETVVKVFEDIINLLQSNYVPADLKKNGRKAFAYGYFAFAKTPDAKTHASIIGVSMEDKLVEMLVECKEIFVSLNENFRGVFEFCNKYEIDMMEVSTEDTTWGGLVVPKELTKANPKPEGVSVIGHMLALIAGLNVEETQKLQNWSIEPFSGEIMEKIKIIGTNSSMKGFNDLIRDKIVSSDYDKNKLESVESNVKNDKFIVPGKNRLGDTNKKVMTNLAKKFGWKIVTST